MVKEGGGKENVIDIKAAVEFRPQQVDVAMGDSTVCRLPPRRLCLGPVFVFLLPFLVDVFALGLGLAFVLLWEK